MSTVPEAGAVRRMFATIAGRYDRANRILSGGIDVLWRRRLVREVRRRRPLVVADLATGSGDVAFALLKGLPATTRIRAMDFCEPMLDQAKARREKMGLPAGRLAFEHGDCLNLPLSDCSVDAVTIAFGVRNFEDRLQGLREMHRILQPDGHLFILEFSQPYPLVRPFYYFYLKVILPRIAALVTRNKDAYDYLAGTIEDFPDRATLSHQLTQAGFGPVDAIPMSGGIVALHIARRST